MQFDGFLGNSGLKQRLSASFSGGQISHCYLICGPEGSGKHTLAAILAAAMECTGAEPPCGRCSACRKALSGQHPDIITVDDEGKKNISVDTVRDARSDLFLRPNEGRKKIYIIPRAQDLGLPAQNALLKILEEPPEYGAFLLLTTNAEKLLPTIRSRCAELHLSPVGAEAGTAFLKQHFPDLPDEQLRGALVRSGGFLGQAMELLRDGAYLPQTAEFAQSYAARDVLRLLGTLLPMEKWKREQVIPVLTQWRQLLCEALSVKSGLPASSPQCTAVCRSRSSSELLAAVRALQTALDDLNANVGVGSVIGWLTIPLR